MQVLSFKQPPIIEKMKYLITLSLLFFLTFSAFAVDLTVTGITTPSAANGTYVPNGTFNGHDSWKHQTQDYYIYFYEETFIPEYFWYISDAKVLSQELYYPPRLFQSSGSEAIASPSIVSSWIAVDGTGSPSVAEVSVNPEINIKGNGTSIASGDASASFSDFTKFGSALPNSGSATRTFTIENTGAAALTVGTIGFSGANNSDFSVTSSPASSVAASGSTTFTVTFAPTGTGSRDATISIVNSDSDENPYTFALNGYGYVAKTLVVSGITTPEAANGNYIHQGVSNNFEYWKHATENYYIFNNLANGIRIWYIDTNQDYTDGILFSKSSESPSPSGLTGWTSASGTGSPVISETTPTPEINVVGNNSKNIVSGDNSPKLFYGTNFGSLDYASGTRTRTFTIQNTGTAALPISDVTITETDASQFAVTTTPATSVAASESTTFVVTFDPTSVGTKTATVTINNNDSDEGTYTFLIQGDGFTAKSLVVSGITTPSAANGTYTYQGILNEFQYWKHSSQDYYIYNTVEYESYHWHIDTNTEAAAGASAYNFRSANNGENVSPVNVSAWSTTSGNEGSPSVVYAEPEINVTGNSVAIVDGDATPSIYDHTDFGWITSGFVVRTYTIQNLGTETLTLTGSSPYVVIGGTNSADFSVTTPPSATIAAGGSTTFQVTATPSALGTRSATLSIANTDTDENPYNFSIEVGLGILPVVTTQAVSNIGSTNAICNGTITDLGVPNPTAYGICYGASANPEITGSKVDKGTASATGAFTAQITGLTIGTTYHARAYATNNLGTVYGDDVTFTTTATMTEPGNALNFDGTNDYVAVPFATTSLTSFTIETWINPATIPESGLAAILNTNTWDATNGGIHFQFEDGFVELAVYELGGGWPAMSTKLATNKWQHIAAVYDGAGGTVKFYLNGVLDNTVSKTLPATKISAAEIGAYTSSRYFNGKLDEFRVWNLVRSQAQIQADMDNSISASTSGLMGYYNFNEGTTGSTMLPDLTSNGNNGTLTNFALTGSTSNWVESYAMVVPTVAAETDLASTSFTANWSAPVLGTVNNYLLEVATDAAFTSLVSGYNPKTIAAPSTSSVVSGLSSHTQYYYRLRADKTSVTGQGAYSNSISTTTLFPTSSTFNTNGDWSTAGNWNNGLPGSSTEVTISANCNADGNFETGNIVISATGALTIATGKALTVNGDLDLESDNEGTGSLINNGTLSVSGTTTAQRFMTADKWHIISPIAATQTVANFLTANTNIPEKSGNRGMMDYSTAENKWNSYYPATGAAGNMDAGKGYSARVAADGTVTFTGTLTSGNKTVSLTKISDDYSWNCIGNPYPSAINMNTTADATNNFISQNASVLDASYACIYVWDEDVSYTGQNCYKIISNSGYISPTGKANLGQNYIGSGQGFFVKAATTGTDITFTPAMQTHQPTVAFKSAEISWPGFELTATSGDVKASTVVAFNEKMTKGLDPTYDAGLLRGTSGVSIYTRLVDDNGVDFAIQCLPESYNSLVIPLGLDSKTGGEISFSAETVELPATCNVILEDKLTKTFTSLADGATYKATVSAGTTAVGRFYIHTSYLTTGTSGLLPTEGFSLKAYPANEVIWIEGQVNSSAKAYLFSTGGSRLGTFNLQEGNRNSIPASGLATGVYLLKVTDGSKQFNTKIILY